MSAVTQTRNENWCEVCKHECPPCGNTATCPNVERNLAAAAERQARAQKDASSENASAHPAG